MATQVRVTNMRMVPGPMTGSAGRTVTVHPGENSSFHIWAGGGLQIMELPQSPPTPRPDGPSVASDGIPDAPGGVQTFEAPHDWGEAVTVHPFTHRQD